MEKKAHAYLADHPEIKTIYGTKDGFLFSERQNATAHAVTLQEKDVLEFNATAVKVENENAPDGGKWQEKAPTQDAPFDYENIDRELLEDREFLLARYAYLKGDNAPSNIGDEKLAERVQEFEIERFDEKTE